MIPIGMLMNFAICFILLAVGPSAEGAVKQAAPNMEALWRHYLDHEAGLIPTVKYPYDSCFRAASQKYNLPLTLLLAVARGESNFNPRAKSDRNCHGLMQIQWPGTARHLGIYRLSKLYEPCTNIRAGARYLRELLDRYGGNLHLALAAYNYGPGRISNQSGAGSIPHGAQWYSGYIHHHLEYIVRGATVAGGGSSGRPQRYHHPERLVLITFNQPYRAKAYYQHLQKRAPSLNLDWYRISLGRYQVVMLYADNRALEAGRERLNSLGVMIYAR